jgi:hypothetical protein
MCAHQYAVLYPTEVIGSPDGGVTVTLIIAQLPAGIPFQADVVTGTDTLTL